jgi:8-oxo-dGTP diphosphatase
VASPLNDLLRAFPGTEVERFAQPLSQQDFDRQKATPRVDGGAIGVVRIDGDSIVLTARSRPPHRGWALPGGCVEPGEAFDSALKREVMEETGLRVVITRALVFEDKTFVSPRGESLPFLLAAFEAEADDGAEPVPTADATAEGLVAAVFPISRLPAAIILRDREKIERAIAG